MCLFIDLFVSKWEPDIEDNGAVVLGKHPGSNAAINHQMGDHLSVPPLPVFLSTHMQTHTHSMPVVNHFSFAPWEFLHVQTCLFFSRNPKHFHLYIISSDRLLIQFGGKIKITLITFSFMIVNTFFGYPVLFGSNVSPGK